MKVSAICIGTAQRLPGKSYRTGIFKASMTGPVLLDQHGLLGDSVCNRKHHGGPDQAVYGMGSVDIDGWTDELGRRPEPGLFGENLIIEGVDSRNIRVGDRFETGTILLEVTSTRIPCATLAARMGDGGFAKRFMAVARPGFYCRVLSQGLIGAGEPVHHEAYPDASISMPDLLALTPRKLSDEDRARLIGLPISERLRQALKT
ncbi:MOSC domain-containing protein [Rhizobium sp. SSA_523]|uniref:MOSC domain-containing protein n=1 Tax=Rhizobium sp. SSA_523 TaxID=2952477 RepID=UPI00209013F0|nr:MOSC domain-containing protein [Rhizobium sp. SSA_523]MCO5732900.1 MOSC domain-containing protein [Rhizobium sp. SSA_523]WKC23484.1 MOSC domain-containing protein [Rhizobium sp. SSA_523]